MICWTSRVSRSLSICIREANLTTASGSSAAWATASASRLMAPTGVLSSWLTLATKSRRMASTRRSLVRSSTSTRTSRLPSGATRAAMLMAGPLRDTTHHQLTLPDLAVPPYQVHHLEQVRRRRARPADHAEQVRRRAGLEHLVVRDR